MVEKKKKTYNLIHNCLMEAYDNTKLFLFSLLSPKCVVCFSVCFVCSKHIFKYLHVNFFFNKINQLITPFQSQLKKLEQQQNQLNHS